MTDAPIESLAPGTMVDGFRVERVIGEGAMAVVYLATQVSLDRPVALKVLPRELSKDSDYVERFFNEARAAGALSHPHIVQAFDAGVAEGNICYFAMEYVEGETLGDRIEREGALPVSTSLQIGIDIAGALAYGWQRQQLNHGDIKPANILITERGETKLADFGLAKVGTTDFQDDGIMLTPLYASPEMIRGETGADDCAADIYSFGAMLYHMVTGSPPFPHEDAHEVMRRQLHEALTPAHKRNSSVPPRLSKFLSRMLSKEAAERPREWTEVMAELETQLEQWQHKKSVTAHAKAARPSAREAKVRAAVYPARSRLTVAAAVVAVFTTAIVILLLLLLILKT